ncbi:hypothetical protein B0A50_08355 [Salinomyces thailandicus]|uniref:Uncharacterized protein n=1 Tax=Salinomyces thailandicus TaxID=706561 RepID=A0A4V5N332_9PEZI|nr:hypothetical protein B0A50_08355 [Salinomyces thailandica]
MRDLLKSRNYAVGSIRDTSRLREGLRRWELGQISYHAHTNDELRTLIVRRKLDISRFTDVGNRGTRGELLDLLERDDREPKFYRFTELPPELRNRIYEYHFAGFRQPIYAPSQPPITVASSMLRGETLQVFYNVCEFEIRLKVCWSRTRQRLEFGMEKQQVLFLQSTVGQHLGWIKSLRLVASWERDLRVRGSWSGVPFNGSKLKFLVRKKGEGQGGEGYEVQSKGLGAEEEGGPVGERIMKAKVKLWKLLGRVKRQRGMGGLRAEDVLDMRMVLECALLR